MFTRGGGGGGALFTKEVSSRLAKRPLVFNGRLANRELTSLVKEASGRHLCIAVPTESTSNDICTRLGYTLFCNGYINGWRCLIQTNCRNFIM